MQNMVARCKQCLGALQATDQVIPRQEVIEYCTVFLLNMAEWDYLTSLEKRWSYTEFAAAVSNVCQDIVKYKGTRKFPREAWDISTYFSTENKGRKIVVFLSNLKNSTNLSIVLLSNYFTRNFSRIISIVLYNES